MVRDYCYVGDVVQANILALGKGGEGCFNIGTGKGTKTLGLFRAVYDAVRDMRPGIPRTLAEPDRKQARPGDLKRSCLVFDKAMEGLGWAPRTSLKEGIRRTLEWRLAE